MSSPPAPVPPPASPGEDVCPRNFGELWAKALRRYKEETKKDLLNLPFAIDFPSIPPDVDIVEAVTAHLMNQKELFKVFRDNGEKARKVLKLIVNAVLPFLDACAEVASDATPGGKAIFCAIGALLQATKSHGAMYDSIESLFETIKNRLKLIEIHLPENSPSRMAPPVALMNIFADTLEQVFIALALITKYCKLAIGPYYKRTLRALFRRTKDYARVFSGEPEVAKVLKNFEVLAHKGLELAVAHSNFIARELHPWVKFVYDQAVEDQLRTWLNPTDRRPPNYESKRRANSCEWFYDAEFGKWKDQKGGAYWVHGNAGSGKSVLSSSVIDTLQADETLFVAYFFFDTEKRDCRALASSLVFQLGARSEKCSNWLQDQKRRSSDSPHYEDLIAMLGGLLELSGRTFIIVDALDECPLAAREGLRSFFNIFRAPNIGQKDLHLLVTSRPEADIRDLISPLHHRALNLHDSQKHQADVRAYITSRLDRSVEGWAPEVKKKVHTFLNENSRGMFLWVDLQLLQLRGSITLGDVVPILNELPTNLNDTYKRILEKSGTMLAVVERRRRVFECVASARRPLFPAEVVEIYCMDFDSQHLPKQDEVDHETFVLRNCPGLLCIVDWTDTSNCQFRTVQFIHFSAKEYLMSIMLESAATPARHHRFDEYSANLAFAKICLRALHVDVTYPHLRAYANEHWEKHVSLRNEDDLGDCLDAFLQIGSPSFTLWAAGTFRLERDTAFHCAARLNLCNRVKRMLDSDGTLITLPGEGGSALHEAAPAGHVEMCHLLLDRGALINDPDDEGNTPVHTAADQGRRDVVELLLHYREADIDEAELAARYCSRNDYGVTPLGMAVYGNADICRLFLAYHGAPIDDPADDGNTPLHYAAAEGFPEIVSILLEHPVANGAHPGARCRARNDRGETPLHLAANEGYADVCRILLRHEAAVDELDNRGDTAVHIAHERRDADIVRMLLEHRAKDATSALPSARRLRKDMYPRARREPNGPWSAILVDFASQLEDPGDGSDSD
ncbi:unnamed protein product [Peniophora sp. CBMAI 1063]|nr:unnamed protein product [Peniophora sp. CBMAI 1063]